MTKNAWFWITIFLVIVLLVYYLNNEGYLSRGTKKVTYNLPVSKDPDTFGPYYWNVLHSTVADIPCGACRGEAVSFMKFFHDRVNLKLKKPLYDEENFRFWITKLCTEYKNYINAQ